MEVKNKVVVITGAARGIGLKIAECFLEKGAIVIILDIINEGNTARDELAKKYGNHNVEFYLCDVTRNLEDIFLSLTTKYKTIDVLVNNAGVINERSIQNTMDINATAVMKWTMKFWEYMRKDKGGKGGTIINISSLYGYFTDPYLPFYKAAKHAVIGFSKTLGHEKCFKKTNVRVITICPGFVETKLLEEPNLDVNFGADFVEYMKKQVWQSAEDVAKATVEVYEKADSGTIWSVIGGEVTLAPCSVE